MIPGLVLTIAAAVGVVYFVRRLERRAYEEGYVDGQEDADDEIVRLQRKSDRLQRLVNFAGGHIDPDDDRAVQAAVEALINDATGGGA